VAVRDRLQNGSIQMFGFDAMLMMKTIDIAAIAVVL